MALGFGFRIDHAKGLFFDTLAVEAAATRTERRVLSRFGAYVRRRARSSIRRRKKPSEPGSPPSSHTGLLRQFIWFFYDADERSVIIGPARLNTTTGNVPEILEYGGRAVIVADYRKKRTRVVYVRARPYMRPAFDAELQQLPKLWANSIK